ncbi:MAG: DUF2779 domain-containing protein [Anaeroplasma bactoclasticum]|nr:DUF2779 domain-containing protein [Anaeroplasma bactoclasticum]
MNISKTLFKNLTRCKNFPSLYDIYMNRSFHEVQAIDGKKLEKDHAIMQAMSQFAQTNIESHQEEIIEMLNEMFDIETGEDLTNITNPQLEAFQTIFTEVERLAILHVSNVFQHPIIASTNTYEQKKYEYRYDGNTFYCFLDGYLEDEEKIYIFEVKATTSRKYDDLKMKIKQEEIPLFKSNEEGISTFVGDQLVGQKIGSKTITQEMIDKKKQKLLNRYSDCGKYIYDLSVERHIIEQSLIQKHLEKPKSIAYYLVVLNAEYRFSGRYNSQQQPIYDQDAKGNALFKIYDFSDITKLYQNQIQIERDQLMHQLTYLEIHSHQLGEHCEYKKTTACKFCKICMKDVLCEGSILEYTGKHYAFTEEQGGKKKIIPVYDLINRGYATMEQAYPYITKLDNIVEYQSLMSHQPYMDKERIRYALASIQYPIYYLDFESYNCPLPRYKGESPYQQSLFQYSLHIEKSENQCDLIQNHREFLAPDHQDRRLELVKQLIKDIDLSAGGTVMVYNKSFEKTRLKELSYIYPQYKKELDTINNHIFDLLEVLKGTTSLYEKVLPEGVMNESNQKPSFTYYHYMMHGSFSIKKVLPLFTDLSYQDLEVKNGTEAIITYGLFPYFSEEEYQNKYLALRTYCRQDTWAMVCILRGLKKEVLK